MQGKDKGVEQYLMGRISMTMMTPMNKYLINSHTIPNLTQKYQNSIYIDYKNKYTIKSIR